jgi:hypothetical protein
MNAPWIPLVGSVAWPCASLTAESVLEVASAESPTDALLDGRGEEQLQQHPGSTDDGRRSTA